MKQFVYIMAILMLASTVAAATTDNYGLIDIVLLNQDPDPAEPGTYVEIRWKVQKEGTRPIEDVTFTLDAKYPFSIDKSESAVKELKDWEAYTGKDEYYTLYYKVLVDPDAIEGEYDLGLNITTNNPETIIEHKTFSIRVDDSKDPELNIGLMKTEPSKLMPDSTDNKITLEILNLGEDDAELVVATIKLPEGFENTYSYSSVSSLGTITGGSAKNAVFYIDTTEDVKEGSYPATLTLKYREEGETIMKTKDIPVSLEVKNKPTFKIMNVSYEPQQFHPGETVKMKVSIVNTGSKDAESVSLRAFKESSQPFEFEEKSDFIGTLRPGQEGMAVIEFSIDDDASAKEYLMDLELRSIYNGDVFLQQESANVDVKASQAGFFAKYWIVIIIVIAVLLIGAYLLLKKK